MKGPFSCLLTKKLLFFKKLDNTGREMMMGCCAILWKFRKGANLTLRIIPVSIFSFTS